MFVIGGEKEAIAAADDAGAVVLKIGENEAETILYISADKTDLDLGE